MECYRKTVTVGGHWLCNHATKFARWQHPAMGHKTSFAVPCCTCSFVVQYLAALVMINSF